MGGLSSSSSGDGVLNLDRYDMGSRAMAKNQIRANEVPLV